MSLRKFLAVKKVEQDLCKFLAETLVLAVVHIRQAVEGGRAETIGLENVHGEKQIELDVQADGILEKAFQEASTVASFASEERENLVTIKDGRPFTIVYDPLDGSSLVNVNFTVGTIFGVYEGGSPLGKKGRDQLASGFVVYGPRTTLIVCPGKGLGVHEFLMGEDGQFMLVKENLKIDEKAKYFAPGNLRAGKEREDYRKLIEYWILNQYTLRYSGGMVPDINHIFIKGNGIFTYPPYSEMPEGKLRLLYECAPMAFLAEEAGGEAVDGEQKILDKEIKNLHQRSPIFIGSKSEVRMAQKMLKGAGNA